TAAAAALVAVLVLDSPENTAPSVAIAFAQVTATDGLVNVTRGNRERIVDAGEAFEMLVGDRISTSETGRLALRLSAESELRLNTETIVEITRTQAVRLVSGMVYFDAQPQAQGTDFSVHTDFGVVSHLGTQYAAGIDSQGLHVRVREGEAAVSDSGLFDDSVAMRVAPGEQLQIDTMGRVSRSPYSVDHPGWTWAQELARVPDDGPLSVADLLDWDARATGRAVQFDSEAARNLAEGVMLNQVGGLSPADVLGVINSTTNLEVSESGTTLNVASR
ncbi:MAG TPA: FecR family protein, partial [Gammaproteobacteria bacterium]|nr:FecR family protein [Gammaproteobacteria bacterium]